MSPKLGKYNKIEEIAQIQVKIIKKNFLYPDLSAKEPSIGERTATRTAVIDIPQDHNNVPKLGSEQITEVKNAP